MSANSSLTEEHYGMLRRYAMSLCRNKHDAEDLTHDTVVRALAAWDSFDGRNVRGWLFTIMRNKFLSDVRRRRVEVLIEAGVSGGQEEAVLLREVVELLEDDILLLSAAGIRLEDIASLKALPVNTVKSRIWRGRDRLKRRVK